MGWPSHKEGCGKVFSLLTTMIAKKRCANFRSELARWIIIYLERQALILRLRHNLD